jgi:hypothetical protein
MQIALVEPLLLAGSAVLPLIGLSLRRLLHNAELAVMAATGVGAALAAALWRASTYMPSP